MKKWEKEKVAKRATPITQVQRVNRQEKEEETHQRVRESKSSLFFYVDVINVKGTLKIDEKAMNQFSCSSDYI